MEGVRMPLRRRRREGVDTPVVLRSSSESGEVEPSRRRLGARPRIGAREVEVVVLEVEDVPFNQGRVRVMAVVAASSCPVACLNRTFGQTVAIVRPSSSSDGT